MYTLRAKHWIKVSIAHQFFTINTKMLKRNLIRRCLLENLTELKRNSCVDLPTCSFSDIWSRHWRTTWSLCNDDSTCGENRGASSDTDKRKILMNLTPKHKRTQGHFILNAGLRLTKKPWNIYITGPISFLIKCLTKKCQFSNLRKFRPHRMIPNGPKQIYSISLSVVRMTYRNSALKNPQHQLIRVPFKLSVALGTNPDSPVFPASA